MNAKYLETPLELDVQVKSHLREHLSLKTAITKNNGNFFVGNLIPASNGSSNVYKITPDGQINIFARGFSAILGVAFDTQNRLYVLENVEGGPGAGDIIRITPPNKKEVIASVFPRLQP